MAAALKKLSFFGSVLQFLNRKDETQVQSARSAKISSYEDEIKLLLDAGARTALRANFLHAQLIFLFSQPSSPFLLASQMVLLFNLLHLIPRFAIAAMHF